MLYDARRVVRLGNWHYIASGKPMKFNTQCGMTLVELLVTLTILGLISLGLAHNLSFGVRVWDRVADLSEATDRISQTQNFLRRQITASRKTVGLASTPQAANAASVGGKQQAFSGARDHLVFTAPWLTSLAQGGLYRFELQRAGDGLQLAWEPAEGIDAEFAGSSSDTGGVSGRRILIDEIASLTIRYYGSDDGRRAATWRDQWSAIDRLPDLLEVEIEFANSKRPGWPTMMISIPR